MASMISVFLVIYALMAGALSASPTVNPTPGPASPTPIRAGVNITVFNDTNCGHSHVFTEWNHTFYYGIMWPTNLTTQSYILSRALSSQERLDWNTPYPSGTAPPGGMIPEDCGTFQQTTNPDPNNHTGDTLHAGVCYLVTGGATCVNLWNLEWPPFYNYATGLVQIFDQDS